MKLGLYFSNFVVGSIYKNTKFTEHSHLDTCFAIETVSVFECIVFIVTFAIHKCQTVRHILFVLGLSDEVTPRFINNWVHFFSVNRYIVIYTLGRPSSYARIVETIDNNRLDGRRID